MEGLIALTPSAFIVVAIARIPSQGFVIKIIVSFAM